MNAKKVDQNLRGFKRIKNITQRIARIMVVNCKDLYTSVYLASSKWSSNCSFG
jgi:hypothetical protein